MSGQTAVRQRLSHIRRPQDNTLTGTAWSSSLERPRRALVLGGAPRQGLDPAETALMRFLEGSLGATASAAS